MWYETSEGITAERSRRLGHQLQSGVIQDRPIGWLKLLWLLIRGS